MSRRQPRRPGISPLRIKYSPWRWWDLRLTKCPTSWSSAPSSRTSRKSGAQFMDRPQLIEERQRQPGHLVRVLRIIIEAARKPTRAGQQLRGATLFFLGSDAGRILFGDQIEKKPSRTPTPGTSSVRRSSHFASSGDNDGGDAHHLGAIFAHSKDAHSAGNIETQQAPRLIAEQAHVDRRNSFDHRPGSKAHKRLGISAASHGHRAGKIRRRRQGTVQQRKNVMAQALGVVLVDGALDRIGFHQPNRAERQADAMFENAALEEIQLQTAAAQIKNQPRPVPCRRSTQWTAEQTSRASSSLLITSSSMPDFRRMRSISRR